MVGEGWGEGEGGLQHRVELRSTVPLSLTPSPQGEREQNAQEKSAEEKFELDTLD